MDKRDDNMKPGVNVEALKAILEDADELISRYGLTTSMPPTWKQNIINLCAFAVVHLMWQDPEATPQELIEAVRPTLLTAFGMGVAAEREGTA